MKKQINVYLSEKDIKKLEALKEVHETEKSTELIRLLIQNEYTNYQKWKDLLEN